MLNLAPTKLLYSVPVGEDNAVTAAELCARFDMTERELRQAFEALRKSGEVICSCDHGFFKPETKTELEKYISRESKRARSVFFSLKSARKLLKEWENTK